MERFGPPSEQHRHPCMDLVGANNIFQFAYNTLQLDTLDPTNDVGLAQMVMGSQTRGVTPMALAAAFQIFYDGLYTTRICTRACWIGTATSIWRITLPATRRWTPQTAYVMNRLLKNVLYSNGVRRRPQPQF